MGTLWEERLGHPENALLRYREACEPSPGSTEARERAARAADALGHWAHAAEHFGALLSSLRPGTPGASERSARAHRAMARIAELRLSDPARAASHLESALAAEPGDAASLERLADLYRRLGRPAELLATIDRMAPLAGTPAARAALLAEAGAIGLDALGLVDAARSRFAAALAADPRCRPALEGLVRIAADRGEAAAEREALEKLALLPGPGAELAAVQDRLVAACERSGDLAGAVRAAAAARRAPATLAVITPSSGGFEATMIGLNPLAYYRLNETNDPSAGTAVAFDYWGGHNGLYASAASNLLHGILGPQAPTFYTFENGNGAVATTAGVANSFVTAPFGSLSTNTVTMCMWVNPVGANEDYAGLLVNRGSGVAGGFGYTGGQIGYTWNNNNANTYSFRSGLVPPLNQGHLSPWWSLPPMRLSI